MRLREAFEAGELAVTAELGPPLNPDPEPIRRTARALVGYVHAANVTDNQAATVKVAPLACSVLMMEEGLEPILQMTTRDRNVMAMQADLLGAWALGVRTVLALSGDPLSVGRYEPVTRPVSDLDSLGLVSLVTGMNSGRLAAGESLDVPTGFRVASAVNPLVDDLARLERKLDAGTHLFQTNVVYDVERFAGWFEPVVRSGIAARAPVLVGVMPPRSAAGLAYMHERIPGVEVDQATLARMKGLRGDKAREVGIEIAVEVVQRLRRVPGVAGVHIMAPGWEAEAVPRVVEDASIGHAAGRRLDRQPTR